MISLYVHRLAAYEYCPARYRLETSRKLSEPTSKFEVYQLLFKQYFRSLSFSKNNTEKMKGLVKHYRDILFPKGESVSAEVMVAYAIKCFEKLYYQVKTAGSYVLPDTLVFEENDVSLRLTTDLIYTDVNKEKSSRFYQRRRVNFVYLIPKSDWDPISLSNRLEVLLTYKYLLPKLVDTSTSFSIMFLNPEDGRVFEISGEELDRRFAADQARLTRIINSIKKKEYIRRPVGVLCKKCPQYDKCTPRNYVNETAFVDMLNL